MSNVIMTSVREFIELWRGHVPKAGVLLYQRAAMFGQNHLVWFYFLAAWDAFLEVNSFPLREHTIVGDDDDTCQCGLENCSWEDCLARYHSAVSDLEHVHHYSTFPKAVLDAILARPSFPRQWLAQAIRNQRT